MAPPPKAPTTTKSAKAVAPRAAKAPPASSNKKNCPPGPRVLGKKPQPKPSTAAAAPPRKVVVKAPVVRPQTHRGRAIPPPAPLHEDDQSIVAVLRRRKERKEALKAKLKRNAELCEARRPAADRAFTGLLIAGAQQGSTGVASAGVATEQPCAVSKGSSGAPVVPPSEPLRRSLAAALQVLGDACGRPDGTAPAPPPAAFEAAPNSARHDGATKTGRKHRAGKRRRPNLILHDPRQTLQEGVVGSDVAAVRSRPMKRVCAVRNRQQIDRWRLSKRLEWGLAAAAQAVLCRV